jgi:cell division protein FtsI (penicillin-binding protein 3)
MTWRHYVLLVVLLGFTMVLAGRVVYLATTDKEFLQKEGDARSIRNEAIGAQRGVIRDRWGEALAISTPVYNVVVDPSVQVPNADAIKELATLLQLDAAEISGKLQNRKRQYVVLKPRITWDEAESLRERKFDGVKLETVYRRYYPAGEVAAHVVGFSGFGSRSSTGQSSEGEDVALEVGLEGIEMAFDDKLRALPGRKTVLRDRKGQNVRDIEYVRAPKHGEDLTLSIDLRLQYLAYRELKAAVTGHNAASGSLVMLDVKTGDILALVNQPSYNPNEGAPANSAGMRNKAIADALEPGSTAKPFAALAGLESGRYSALSEFETSPGYIRVVDKTVRDPVNYRLLTLTGVLQKSSQVGIVKLTLDLEREAVYGVLKRAGVGELVSSGLPNENAGSISPAGLKSEVVKVTMAYGYGFTVSPLQLARAYLTLARSGNKSQVSILKSEAPSPGEQVFEPVIARGIVNMLESVTGEGGTARGARIEGYRVAGKTGTARVVGPQGYDDKRHVALFAGMVPVDHPEIVMVVIIHEPSRGQSGGGAVAAPVFARVAERSLRLLGIPGDSLPMTAEQGPPAKGLGTST